MDNLDIKPTVELTIREAVDSLTFLLDCNYVDIFEETEKISLQMAIEALKREGGLS